MSEYSCIDCKSLCMNYCLRGKFVKLEKENSELKAENEIVKKERDEQIKLLMHSAGHNVELDGWVDELKAKLACAIETIRFYANWANYKDQKITEYDCDMLKTFEHPDGEGLVGGKRARLCLRELEGKV